MSAKPKLLLIESDDNAQMLVEDHLGLDCEVITVVDFATAYSYLLEAKAAGDSQIPAVVVYGDPDPRGENFDQAHDWATTVLTEMPTSALPAFIYLANCHRSDLSDDSLERKGSVIIENKCNYRHLLVSVRNLLKGK